jgi:hypothetical protein
MLGGLTFKSEKRTIQRCIMGIQIFKKKILSGA